MVFLGGLGKFAGVASWLLYLRTCRHHGKEAKPAEYKCCLGCLVLDGFLLHGAQYPYNNTCNLILALFLCSRELLSAQCVLATTLYT